MSIPEVVARVCRRALAPSRRFVSIARLAWQFRRDLLKRARVWLLAEDDELASDPGPASRGAGVQGAGDFIVDAVLHLAGLAALVLVVYFHVPAVQSVVSSALHPERKVANAAATRRDRPARREERAGGGRPRESPTPATAPSPPPLVGALALSGAAPRVAVCGDGRVAFFTAAGERLWSHAAMQADFSPTGEAVLLDCGSAGWTALDCRTGKALAWSEALIWIPPSAQIQWSPCGQFVAFEWPVDDECDRMAIGVFSPARKQWVARAAVKEDVACALSFAFSADERRLAVPVEGGALLFDLETGKMARAAFPGDGMGLLWYPDGKRLLAGDSNSAGEGCAPLHTYDTRSGEVLTTLMGEGSSAAPIAWADNGRALIYEAPRQYADVERVARCLVRWPTGDLLQRLGRSGSPKVDASGKHFASYALDSERGGAGTLWVGSIGGRMRTIAPEPLVGIPLKWIETRTEDDEGESIRSRDWLLDYGWEADRPGLYLLARRGDRAWGVWKWEPGAGAPRPIGRVVCPADAGGDFEDLIFELVFARRR